MLIPTSLWEATLEEDRHKSEDEQMGIFQAMEVRDVMDLMLK